MRAHHLGQFRHVARGLVLLQIRAQLWSMYRRLGRRELTVRTQEGLFRVYCRDNGIGRSLYIERGFERRLIKNALVFLRRRGRLPARGHGAVLDIGANIGVTSIALLLNSEFSKSIAIEPEPENFLLLQKNIMQNQLQDAIRCIQVAASDSDGVIPFELSQDNLGDHRIRPASIPEGSELFAEGGRKVINVKTQRLDNLIADLPSAFAEEIALAWVDTQGHEGHVFLGGEALLRSGIPVVAEITPYMLQRAGMGRGDFCRIVQRHWTSFGVMRSRRVGKDGFVEFPVSSFPAFFDSLGYEGDYEEVIFLT